VYELDPRVLNLSSYIYIKSGVVIVCVFGGGGGVSVLVLFVWVCNIKLCDVGHSGACDTPMSRHYISEGFERTE
jgi:hypothetical protein